MCKLMIFTSLQFEDENEVCDKTFRDRDMLPASKLEPGQKVKVIGRGSEAGICQNGTLRAFPVLKDSGRTIQYQVCFDQVADGTPQAEEEMVEHKDMFLTSEMFEAARKALGGRWVEATPSKTGSEISLANLVSISILLLWF